MPYLTPPSTPTDDFCRSILIPDEPIWVGTFTGALYPLTFEYSWEQSEGGITPVEAAEKARQIFYQYLESGCGSISARIYRPKTGSSGNFGYEYTDDGGTTWVDDDPLPPRPERTEPNDDDKRCLAARNATEVYRLFFNETIDYYNNNVEPALALSQAITATMLGLFYPPALLFVEPIFAGVYAIFEFLTINDWDDEVTNDLTCILLSHTTVNPDDTVTFDFESINNEVGGKILEGRIWLQISYFINMLGSDALNRAGSTTSITSYDCSVCNTWCYTFDFSVSDHGFSTVSGGGVWSSGTGWLTTTQRIGTTQYRVLTVRKTFATRTITEMRAEYEFTKGFSDTTAEQATGIYLNGFTNRLISVALPNFVPSPMNWEGSVNATNLSVQLMTGADLNSTVDPGGYARLSRLTVKGTGTNPFGNNNCQ